MLSRDAATRISALIMAKRRETELGLRAAAAESKISPSTLSRLERGAADTVPDTETMTKLARWLNVSVDELLVHGSKAKKTAGPDPTTPEVVAAHLRADKNLSSQTAEALAEMFKAMYAQFVDPPSRQRLR
ncbi:MAG TPA: helix-turn-helix transcriptional regulator [Tepidisphaeraceae bacterium]|jgi:transcriptional regulator with XRE-family HTH domain